MRGDAFLGLLVHLVGADLHLERRSVFADDGRMQRLIAVRTRHRDEVFDPAGHRRPGLMDDPQGSVASLIEGVMIRRATKS